MVFGGWAGRPPGGTINAGEAAGRPVGTSVADEMLVGIAIDVVTLTVVVIMTERYRQHWNL